MVRLKSEMIAAKIMKELRHLGYHVNRYDVQKAPAGMTLWFMPFELQLLPVFIVPGENGAWRAVGAGSKGENLGNTIKNIAKNLVKYSKKLNKMS